MSRWIKQPPSQFSIPGKKLHGPDVVRVGLHRLYPDVLPELGHGGILLLAGRAIDYEGGVTRDLTFLLDHFSHLIVARLEQGHGRVLFRSHDDVN